MSSETYDPSLEFPGIEGPVVDEQPIGEVVRKPFHLVVLKSPVLSSKRRIAIISSHPEVSIGRDRAPDATSPRLRLKEMAVSKYHAILYWYQDGNAWGLVDVGSVHGTFIQKGSGNGHEERLSPSKVASHPRYLHHLDVLRIGTTTLVCHLHDVDEPFCEECNVTPTSELHLISDISSTSTPISSGTDSIDPVATTSTSHKDVKTSLAGLKRHLLSRHPQIDSHPKAYVDRAAVRREQLGTSQPPVIPSSLPSIPVARLRPQRPLQEQALTPDTPLTSTPQAIPDSNIGHRLLAKQGWTPGSGLGADQTGRSEPLVTKSSVGRAGIGIDQSSR